MPLSLLVKSYNNNIPETPQSITIQDTCTIGRSASNDFELPDVERIISHLHATIHFENDTYTITDNSTNGVFINQSSEAIGQDNKIILHNNDEIILGKYTCIVTITTENKPNSRSLLDDAQWQPPGHTITDNEKPHLISDSANAQAPVTPPITSSSTDSIAPPVLQQPIEQDYFKPPDAILEDWDALTGFVKKTEHDAVKLISDPSLNKDFSPSDAASLITKPELIPAEPIINAPEAINPIINNPVTSEPDITTPEVTIETPQLISDIPAKLSVPKNININAIKKDTSSAIVEDVKKPLHDNSQPSINTSTLNNQQVVDAFLSGAGLTQLQLEPDEMLEVMHTAGQVLNEITQGFRQIMLSRNSLKNEFRLGMTILQPTENNPIKFSIDVEETLTKLLLPPQKGYMPPINAIHEATDDLQAHQMALLSGLRAALGSLINLFDPVAFENDLKNSSTVEKMLPSIKKARYWEQFKICYKEAAADAENDFMHFLGKEFTIAYEQQIQIIKTNRRENNQ